MKIFEHLREFGEQEWTGHRFGDDKEVSFAIDFFFRTAVGGAGEDQLLEFLRSLLDVAAGHVADRDASIFVDMGGAGWFDAGRKCVAKRFESDSGAKI